MKLSLIVPFYNEEGGIVERYRELRSYLDKHYSSHELIFVNDGSCDNSVEVLKKAIRGDKKARLIAYTKNQGRGYAVMTGFKNAKGHLIGYIDSDSEIKPKYIGDVIKLTASFDGAVVSKHHPKSKVSTSKKRRLASKLFNFWVRLILYSKVTDHQAGLKIFRAEVVKKILPLIKEKGWLFDVEFLYYAQKSGFTIGQVPIKVEYGFGRVRKSMVLGFLSALMFVVKLKYGIQKN